MSEMNPLTSGKVPLLDPSNNRFPDEFAPPIVAFDADRAAAAASVAEASRTQAAAAASTASGASNTAAEAADVAVSSREVAGESAEAAAASANAANASRAAAQAIKDAINADRGVANGLATLDASGRLPAAMLPVSALEYKGTWNPSTNVPALADGTGATAAAQLGDMYRVTVAGTRNTGAGAITYAVGDYAIHNGTAWEKADTTDQVSSVAGRQGAVVLTKTDVGLANVDNTSDANKPISTATQTALNDTVNDGTIVGDNLVLQKIGGGTKVTGNVRGPQGLPGDLMPASALTDIAAGGTIALVEGDLPSTKNLRLLGSATVTTAALPAGKSGSIVLFITSTGATSSINWPAMRWAGKAAAPAVSSIAGDTLVVGLTWSGVELVGILIGQF